MCTAIIISCTNSTMSSVSSVSRRVMQHSNNLCVLRCLSSASVIPPHESVTTAENRKRLCLMFDVCMYIQPRIPPTAHRMSATWRIFIQFSTSTTVSMATRSAPTRSALNKQEMSSRVDQHCSESVVQPTTCTSQRPLPASLAARDFALKTRRPGRLSSEMCGTINSHPAEPCFRCGRNIRFPSRCLNFSNRKSRLRMEQGRSPGCWWAGWLTGAL